MDAYALTIAGRLVPLAALLTSLSVPAQAADQHAFDVPKGRLSAVLPLLSRQGGVSISVTDASLWKAQVKPVRGRMSIEEAIAHMLAGSKARAVRMSATSWRIEPLRAAPRRLPLQQPRSSPKPPSPPPHVSAAPQDEIIVTGSKTDLPYAQFAGAATMLDGKELNFGGERGTESILSRTANVSSTYLGSGRNKLFIRGIADSSFTGPTQATVGQYLGDIRLAYNAPDPDLRLYDVDGVEILEGPQGTLYGAGSLGGIIRVVPRPPDPQDPEMQVIAGLSATQHGEPGGDIAAIANLPVGDKGHALRLLGYNISEGGYIDNPLLGKDDVNRVHIWGGRGTFRFNAGDDWLIDVGGVYQATDADDAQYTDKDAPPLERYSPVEQNSRARYGMATLVFQKDWDSLRLQSSNAFISHSLFERFDAGRSGEPSRALDQYNDTRMWVSETRLSRPYYDGLGWVVGVSVIDNRTRQRRELNDRLFRSALTGVTNQITEFTAYGEATVELNPLLVATGGVRLAHARLRGEGEDVPLFKALMGGADTAKRNETDFLPSASLLFTPMDNFRLYARYQEGFRPGGLTVERSFVRHFRNDRVHTWEAGMRLGKKSETPVDANLALSYSRWYDIQADFIDGDGFPSTANIGDGRIVSLSGAFAMRPTPQLTFELGGVYNHSRVSELFEGELRSIALAAGADTAESQLPALLARLGQIPNVARYAFRGSATYVMAMGREDFRLNGWANYVGPSRVGIGPVLGESQGDYIDTGLAMRLGNERRGLSFTLTNLFDARGNRFALGTPFVEGSAGYLTPLRPRTLRIAIDVAY
ncbi:TonB-dependent receptor domain-containing protein [Sphingopyxis sp. MWB1]|uniref:TonB-dependent receptor domain-containing protein n=1 Tax=Sphingopyxis sp. MWB1 TaxID=1537715 RepID=UPI00051A2B09|nr:TonB-dependent receptor [Sphingopyxis sp. MWB1]